MAARKPKPAEADVETTSDPEIEIVLDAPVEDTGSTRLVSPTGHETTVPDSIVEKLLDSGYTQV